MCKRWARETAPYQTPFEGETIRLDRSGVSLEQRKHTEQRCQPRWTMQRQMVWWPLWMIWPLVGLLKWLIPQLAEGVRALAPLGRVTLAVPLVVPVVLIAAGLLLLWRR